MGFGLRVRYDCDPPSDANDTVDQRSASDFFNEVVVKDNRFLDISALENLPGHGAVTHMVQDFAVDNVLRGTACARGSTARFLPRP